jgi:hypothetical protein
MSLHCGPSSTPSGLLTTANKSIMTTSTNTGRRANGAVMPQARRGARHQVSIMLNVVMMVLFRRPYDLLDSVSDATVLELGDSTRARLDMIERPERVHHFV